MRRALPMTVVTEPKEAPLLGQTPLIDWETVQGSWLVGSVVGMLVDDPAVPLV